MVILPSYPSIQNRKSQLLFQIIDLEAIATMNSMVVARGRDGHCFW